MDAAAGSERIRSQGPEGRALAGFRASFPLVEAKLNAPFVPPSLVSRRRLIDRLTAVPAPIVSIVAPPGYGKSMLLAEWASEARGAVAWLTIDDFDNEPSVFLTYLAAALDRVRPVDPSIARSLAAAGPRLLGAAVPRLAAALHTWEEPGLLVLDDVHWISDPTCLDALTGVLDHLPPSIRVVLAGRTAAELPMARFRAHRRLLELDRLDLALDEHEAMALVEGTGRTISAADARLLVERTEGWAAAIYLSTLGHDADGHGAVLLDGVSGEQGYIADYIRWAMPSDDDPEDRLLFTRASILDVIEPGLLEATVRVPLAMERLQALAQQNQLITEVGGGSFRYHHLLRDYLRAELEHEAPAAIPSLESSAAAWYLDADRPELAIEHTIRSGDIDATARLITAVAVRVHYGGHHDRLARWMRQFQEPDFERNPGLCVIAGWMHAFHGRAKEADHMAEIADRSTREGPAGDGAASFASSRGMLRAALVRHGPNDALANAMVAAQVEAPGSPWRTSAWIVLGAAHMLQGDATAAEDAFAEASRSAVQGDTSPYLALAGQSLLAIARGDWRSADQLAFQSRDALQEVAMGEAASTILVHAVNARVAMHHGDRQRAGEALVRAQLVGAQVSYALPWLAIVSLLELARTYLAMSDPAGARTVAARAEAILRRRPDMGVLNQQVADMRRRLDVSDRTLSGPSTMTPAELRVLPLLSTHLSFEEIGGRLHITRHTVKAHAVSIYGKLQASSRSEAVARAIEVGLLEPFPGLALGTRALS